MRQGEASAVAYVGFTSDTLSAAALSEYLSRVVQPLLSTLEGVANVETFGGQQLAMRLWLDPQRMAGHGISADQVEQAIRANNVQAAPGQIKGQYIQAGLLQGGGLGLPDPVVVAGAVDQNKERSSCHGQTRRIGEGHRSIARPRLGLPVKLRLLRLLGSGRDVGV